MQNETSERRLSDNLARCSRCGLCLKECPTFAISGLETEGTRGRVQLMLAVSKGDLPETAVTAALDSCLQCRHCEPPCPTGVKIVDAIEDFQSKRRSKLQRLITPWKARSKYLGRRVSLLLRTLWISDIR